MKFVSVMVIVEDSNLNSGRTPTIVVGMFHSNYSSLQANLINNQRLHVATVESQGDLN